MAEIFFNQNNNSVKPGLQFAEVSTKIISLKHHKAFQINYLAEYLHAVWTLRIHSKHLAIRNKLN